VKQVIIRDIDILIFEGMGVFSEIIHFVSARKGGFSNAPFSSLNLGLKVNDDIESVHRNRKLLAEAIGISPSNFVVPSQCHSNNVLVANETHKGRGVFDKNEAIENTDSLVTNTPGLCLLIFAADCVPILLYDPVKKAIGAAHAGWKGTVNRIVQKTVNAMKNNYGSSPSDMVAGIGPSIGPCCYFVNEDVISESEKSFGSKKFIIKQNDNRFIFDMWHANKQVLLDAGLQEKNIEISEMCTFCNHDRFFSHRYDKGITGRFGAGIMLKSQDK
jgi:polyphenol oxidase